PLSYLRCCGEHRDLRSFPTRRSSDLFLCDKAFNLLDLLECRSLGVYEDKPYPMLFCFFFNLVSYIYDKLVLQTQHRNTDDRTVARMGTTAPPKQSGKEEKRDRFFKHRVMNLKS